MKKILFSLTLIFTSALSHATLTNLVVAWNPQVGVNKTIALQIGPNQEASIVSFLWNYQIGGASNEGITNYVVISGYAHPVDLTRFTEPKIQLPLRIAGPAEIRVQAVFSASTFLGSTDFGEILTVDLKDKDPAPTPTGPVVIPADATGPVQIVLESSADLVTWTAAQPGSYAATTQKRFFRVRAIASP